MVDGGNLRHLKSMVETTVKEYAKLAWIDEKSAHNIMDAIIIYMYMCIMHPSVKKKDLSQNTIIILL